MKLWPLKWAEPGPLDSQFYRLPGVPHPLASSPFAIKFSGCGCPYFKTERSVFANSVGGGRRRGRPGLRDTRRCCHLVATVGMRRVLSEEPEKMKCMWNERINT